MPIDTSAQLRAAMRDIHYQQASYYSDRMRPPEPDFHDSVLPPPSVLVDEQRDERLGQQDRHQQDVLQRLCDRDGVRSYRQFTLLRH